MVCQCLFFVVLFCRACFKESLELHRKGQNFWPLKNVSSPWNFWRPFFSRWLRISNNKFQFHVPKFLTTFFSCWLRISNNKLQFHVPKFLMTFFSFLISHSLYFYPPFLHFDPFTKRYMYNCTPNFLWPFFLIHSTFFVFHPSFPPSHFQSYNYNCTIDLLQLQITIFSCRNCHQLHVKICPVVLYCIYPFL